MSDILYYFYMTIELWAFLGILAVAMAVEGLVRTYRQKLVDNPALK